MTILKSSNRKEAEELAHHLLNDDQNEEIWVRGSRGLVIANGELGDIVTALEEFEALAEAVRGKKHLFHMSVSPDPKDPAWTDKDWVLIRRLIEKEFDLKDQPYIEVEHLKTKGNRDIAHRHFVYSRVQFHRKGVRLVRGTASYNRKRNEKVARFFEALTGKRILKGKHNRYVINQLTRDMQKPLLPEKQAIAYKAIVERLEASGIAEGNLPNPIMTEAQWKQQQRTGIKRADVISAAGAFWEQALRGHAEAAFAHLNGAGLKIQRGSSTLVLVDDVGGKHGLPNAISAAMKLKRKSRVKRKQVEDMVKHLRLNLKDVIPSNRGFPSFRVETRSEINFRRREGLRRLPASVRHPWQTNPPRDVHANPLNPVVSVVSPWTGWGLPRSYESKFPADVVVLIHWADFRHERPVFHLYGGGRVQDNGDQIIADDSSENSAKVIVAVAKAKGWESIEIQTASSAFAQLLCDHAGTAGIKIRANGAGGVPETSIHPLP